MLAEQYGKFIRDRRLHKGLKQEELAARAHVSRAVVSQLERGRRRAVQSDTVERLLEALDVQLPELGQAVRDDPRKLARLEEERKLAQRRERHLRLAVELAANERGVGQAGEQAQGGGTKENRGEHKPLEEAAGNECCSRHMQRLSDVVEKLSPAFIILWQHGWLACRVHFWKNQPILRMFANEFFYPHCFFIPKNGSIHQPNNYTSAMYPIKRLV